MTTTATDNQVSELNGWFLPAAADTFSDWIADKGKYAIELASNVSFYMSQVPMLYGHNASASWTQAEKGLKTCKKVLALPNVIKGSITLYEHIQAGKDSVRNLAGEACGVFNDAVDALAGLAALAEKTLPACLSKCLERMKNVSGIYGLGNTAINLTWDIEKLRQIDVTKVDKGIKEADKAKAVEFKQHIIDAEINNKWYDRVRCICVVALSSLGLMTAIPGVAIPAIAFVGITSISLYGKYNMYASKAHGAFWQTRYAELLPVKSSSSAKIAAGV